MMDGNKNERIEVIDVMRGVAVFGILMVNMMFYSTSMSAIYYQIELWPDTWNRVAVMVRELFFDGKFITIFAFLFGFGMILFKERILVKGDKFLGTYSRRLILLFIFGLLHGLLLWYGDILVHYALLGFILLLFHKCKPRTLLIWSIPLLLILPVIAILSGQQIGMELNPEFKGQIMELIKRDEVIYGSGTWIEIQIIRINNWILSAFSQILYYPQILGLFLLGAYFAEKNIFQSLDEKKGFVRKICLFTGIFGFSLTLFYVLIKHVEFPLPDGAVNILAICGALLGSPLVGIFYITVIALLSRKQRFRRLFKPFAAVGRMAFTNYILQSVICTFIFYSYGMGLFGKVGTLAGMLLGISIYVLQIFLSNLWFRFFRMGPLEWLWRWFTYGSMPPFVAKNVPTTPPSA